MEKTKIAMMWLLLAGYYFLAIGPLQESVLSTDVAGVAAVQSLASEIDRMETSLKVKEKRMEKKSGDLKEKLGLLRLTSSDNRTPLDTLLENIERVCRKRGVVLHRVAPLAGVTSGIIELEGLGCEIEFPSEQAFVDVMNGARREETGTVSAAPAMTHSVELRRTQKGVFGRIAFTFLYLKTTSDELKREVRGSRMKDWLRLRRSRAPYSLLALLEPRPAPSPGPVASAVPSRPTGGGRGGTVEASSATSPASSVSPLPALPWGHLRGVATMDGRDAAIVDSGGQKIVLVGEKLGGWTLSEVHTDHVVISSGGQKRTLWIPEEDKPGEAQAPAQPPRQRPATGDTRLGLRGDFRWVSPGKALPAPYGTQNRVFFVEAVEDGTVCSRAGLRAGDRILSIEGIPIRTGDQLLGLRTKLTAGGASAIDVDRNGNLVTLSLEP